MGELDLQWPKYVRLFGYLAFESSLNEFARTAEAVNDFKPLLHLVCHQDPYQGTEQKAKYPSV